MSDTLTIPAKWTDDCQGKKDYDGDLVSVSTRYWPQGGGFWMLKDGKFDTNPHPEIKPSAKSSLLLYVGPKEMGDYVTLISQQFEGDSFEAVRTEVEAWAKDQYERLTGILKREYPAWKAS